VQVPALVQVPPLPVTVTGPVPVLFSTTPVVAPFDPMRCRVIPPPPPAGAMSVFAISRARPVVLSIVLPLPVTWIVPLVSAWRPLPVVVSMSSPPPFRFSVWPSLALITTALLLAGPPVVLIVFVPLLKVVEPPVLDETVMPPPASLVSLIAPLRLTAPPVRLVIDALWPAPLFRVPG